MTAPEGIRIVSAPEAYAPTAALLLRQRIGDAVQRQGWCSLVLAGGNTPKEVYRELVPAFDPAHDTPEARRARSLAGVQLDVYFGDERCVPPDHPDSNYRMAREAFGKVGDAPTWRWFRMEGEREDRTAAARDYAGRLPHALDVLVLGIGDDGHTCSLFPGAPLLDEEVRRVAVALDSPKPPKARLTITPPVIAQARAIVVLVTGEAKAAAVQRALEGPLDPKATPAQLARRGLWVLDRAAASRLAAPTS